MKAYYKSRGINFFVMVCFSPLKSYACIFVLDTSTNQERPLQVFFSLFSPFFSLQDALCVRGDTKHTEYGLFDNNNNNNNKEKVGVGCFVLKLFY